MRSVWKFFKSQRLPQFCRIDLLYWLAFRSRARVVIAKRVNRLRRGPVQKVSAPLGRAIVFVGARPGSGGIEPSRAAKTRSAVAKVVTFLRIEVADIVDVVFVGGVDRGIASRLSVVQIDDVVVTLEEQPVVFGHHEHDGWRNGLVDERRIGRIAIHRLRHGRVMAHGPDNRDQESNGKAFHPATPPSRPSTYVEVVTVH